MREALANYAHDTWADGMRSVFNKSCQHSDGSVTIPPAKADHWRRQMQTEYLDLPIHEQAAGRKQADKILQIIKMFTTKDS